MDYVLFITTFAAASYLPGLNMTMALSLSLNLGYKKTLFMIFGGVLGLGFVSVVCALGASAVIINKPDIFAVLKVVGGIYIIYLGFKMFFTTSSKYSHQAPKSISNLALFIQGFMICNINPKAWIFLVTLLPPFLDKNNPVNFKMFFLIFIIMIIEFISYNTYTLGGAMFKKFMKEYAYILEKISASLMVVIGIWIVLK